MAIRKPKPNPTGGVRVGRDDADMVFYATATERYRPSRRSEDQSPGRKEKVRKQAEEIVERANRKKK